MRILLQLGPFVVDLTIGRRKDDTIKVRDGNGKVVDINSVRF